MPFTPPPNPGNWGTYVSTRGPQWLTHSNLERAKAEVRMYRHWKIYHWDGLTWTLLLAT